MRRRLDRVAVLVVSWLAAAAGHEAGDYLVQSDRAAQNKQRHDIAGYKALVEHVATYAATQHVAKAVALRAAGVRPGWKAVAAGTVVEALLHALIDDGRLLRRFAHGTGKGGFHDLSAAGVNGRALMDQAAHKGLQIPIGALVTTWLASRRTH